MRSRCVSVKFSLLEFLVSPDNGHFFNREQGEWREILILSHSMFEVKGGIKPAGLIYQWGQSHLLVKLEQGERRPGNIAFQG